MKLYNTLTRKKQEFKPIKPGVVTFYSCGPTVYHFAHIGNLRTYIFNDVLQRTLEYFGYQVKRVMNITDVGHLTGDADSGEDKIEKEAAAEHKTPAQIAKFYTEAFFKDLAELNIKKPKIIVPATGAIPEQIALVKKLVAKGYAYETKQAVYFNVSKFKKYGQLSGQSLEEKLTAVRPEVVEDKAKKHPADFALWFKLTGRHKHHLLHWSSPWGKGFPGWHIECSAIASKYLGQPFDIHTGGIDLIGTHHANEIAQSEAAAGVPLARWWLHAEFLLIDKGKMAKSVGNFITLQTLQAKGLWPLAFRYLALTTHYRSPLHFSFASLAANQEAYKNLLELIGRQYFEKAKTPVSEKIEISRYKKKFLEVLGDDLNTAKALALLWEVLRSKKVSPRAKLDLAGSFDQALGLNLLSASKEQKPAGKIPPQIMALAKQRWELKMAKKFTAADSLRLELAKKGYQIEDGVHDFRVFRQK